MTLRELSKKDVIQLPGGQNLGRADDLRFDESARVEGLVLLGRPRLWGLLGRGEEMFIPWAEVESVGADVVLVRTALPAAAPRRGGLLGWLFE